jgi:hypothetical protein
MPPNKTLDATVVPFSSPAATRAVEGARVGWVVGWNAAGAPMVDFPNNPAGPRAARSTVPFSDDHVSRKRLEVVLVFEHQGVDKPIVIGVLEPPTPKVVEADRAPTKPPLEVEVDDERLVLTADKEIVLRCGESELIMRRNGRVVIRGAYVETRATGLNRIKGGSVLIN